MIEKNNINKNSVFKVLIAPLDWGLGHATRCIPLITAFIKVGAEVILAAEKDTKILLKEAFPNIQILELEGYRVKYQKKGSFKLKLLTQIPSILSSIKREEIWLEQIIKKHKIDIVVSDNRYGLNTSLAYTVFITHQLTILTGNKLLDILLQKVNYRFINKFNECWIPDVEENVNLSGKLSHPKKYPQTIIRYIGVLSRFKKISTPIINDFLFLISGPEPQRSIFEEQLITASENISGTKVFVRGKPGAEDSVNKNDNIFYNHLSSEKLNQLVSESEIVICRSGYSTIMDLSATSKKAILIPTPGQKEQEYLASYLNDKNGFIYLKSFNDLKVAIKDIKEREAPNAIASNVEEAVVNLFKNLNLKK